MRRGVGRGAPEARSVLAAIGAVALAGLLSPAAAQSGQGQLSDPTSGVGLSQAEAETNAADTGTQVEEIVVTARRRAESIQDAPLSVTAIAPSQLEAAAAPNIQDLEGLTPNLVIDPNSVTPNSASIAIRGISFEDIEKSFDPAVGVIIDGVYLGTNSGALLNFFDFEAVEILRGPQGTLFGRNTTGGVINVRRTRPTGELGGRFRATFGDYGRQDYKAVVNVPLVEDLVAGKLFYFKSELDGFYYNPIKGRDSGRQQSESFGFSVLFTPTDNFDALLTAEHGHDGGEVVVSAYNNDVDLVCLRLPVPGAVVRLPFGTPEQQCTRRGGDDLYVDFTNSPNDTSLSRNALTLEANWDIGPATLTSVTGYIMTDENVFWDVDGTSVTFFNTIRNQDYQQFSQEFRAAGDIGTTINYVAGLYYFYSEFNNGQASTFGPAFGGAQVFTLADHNAQSYAGFADVDWQITDQLRLTVGGRYTSDRKKLALAFGPLAGAPFFRTNESESWQEFTPKVSVDYKFTDDILAYASFSRGYRSGGFNARAQDPVAASVPYNPETVESFEAGLKTTTFDGRLTFNVAAFTTKYEDKQEEVVVPAATAGQQQTIVANAASATINGLEFEASAVPFENLTLQASLGFLDAQYDEFSTLEFGQTIDLSAMTLRRAPEITGSISGEYEIPTTFGDFNLALSYRYIDEYQTTITPEKFRDFTTLVGGGPALRTAQPARNDPRGLTDSQHNVEASVTYERETPNGTFIVSLFGRNLLDDTGLSGALPVAGLFTFGTPRAPRTYGIEFGYEF